LLSFKGRVILTIHSIEKGGLRYEVVFLQAPSSAWPGQRPANAIAGLIKKTSSWSALRGNAVSSDVALAPAFESIAAIQHDIR
jgi:hypothetical protein